jgi:hypothetical protein
VIAVREHKQVISAGGRGGPGLKQTYIGAACLVDDLAADAGGGHHAQITKGLKRGWGIVGFDIDSPYFDCRSDLTA